MVKLVYCLRKLDSLSLEEFQKYWFEKHAPLVRSHQEALKIRRYVQIHTLDDPLNKAYQKGRGRPDAYDGVAELWWDSLEDMQAAAATPEGKAAGKELVEDEKKFIDLSRSPIWVANERPVIEG